MRSISHNTIGFGLVNISVKIYPAVKTGISLKTLNKSTKNPIKYKKVDSVTGEEVKEELKGYELSKGQIVAVGENDIA